MGNRYPISTEYFCGNCEDEVNGLPVGSRVHSGRPLCYRCTQIGVQEGWAEQQVLEEDKHICKSNRKPGIMILSFFVVAVVLLVAMTMVAKLGRSS